MDIHRQLDMCIHVQRDGATLGEPSLHPWEAIVVACLSWT
jgi:hypothetical protein